MEKQDLDSKFYNNIGSLSWFKYKKKCEHCGKFNTYRMKKITINFDIGAFCKASMAGIEHTEKRYLEIVEAKNATR